MNDHNLQDQDNKKFVCEIHNEYTLQFLYFGEFPKLRSRLLCSKCLIGIINADEKQPAFLLMKEFLSNPWNQLMTITRINGTLIKGNENELFDEIEQLLVKFEETVKNELKIVRESLTQMKLSFEAITTEIKNNLKLNDILLQYQQLGKMDSYQGTNELFIFEEQLNNLSLNLVQTYIGAQLKATDNQKDIISNIHKKSQNIQNEFDLVKKSLDSLNSRIFNSVPEIIRQDLGQFSEIHNQISQGKQIKYVKWQDLLGQVQQIISFINNNDLKKWQQIWGIQSMSNHQHKKQLCS